MKSSVLDNESPYGTYAAGYATTQLIAFIRQLPTNWIGKRLMFAFRRLARLGVAEKLDTEIFGAKLRMYAEGNVSEKRALYAPQFFDLEEREALANLAQDDAVFIDIGANIGLYSFSTAASYQNYKNTRVISIEPHPLISKRLQYNVSLNPNNIIEPMVVALGDREGTLTLVTPGHNLGESRLLKDGETSNEERTEVPVTTLLALLESKKVTKLSGMKIDIEGYEEAVLIPFFEDAPENLLPQLIVIENNYRKWETDLISLAATRGYVKSKTTRMNVILEKQ